MVLFKWYSKIDDEEYSIYINEEDSNSLLYLLNIDDRYYSVLEYLKYRAKPYKEIKDNIITNN